MNRSAWPRVARRLVVATIELAATARALVTMVVVEASIRWLPLPRLSHVLGCRVDYSPSGAVGEPLPWAQLGRTAHRQLRSLRRVARRWPFAAGPCLRSALVGAHLLRRHRPTIRIGTAGAGSELVAHAWIEVAGRPLEDVQTFRSFQVDGAVGHS